MQGDKTGTCYRGLLGNMKKRMPFETLGGNGRAILK
jgi:hypothetical protein